MNGDNQQVMVQLQLAENDFKLRTLLKIHYRWNLQHCYVMKSILLLNQNFQNHFTKINDIDGNELILYFTQGMVFIPHCITINNIEILNNPKNCYNNINWNS